MNINFGSGETRYGPGVMISLTGEEVATAIRSYLTAHNVYIDGPHTITVNSERCIIGNIYVDPSGSVICDGHKYCGRGPITIDGGTNEQQKL